MAPLDRSDREILALLQEDARTSYKQIADSVGLSPSTVYERVRRLRDTGALRGVHAHVAPEALGIRLQAMVFVQLAAHSAGSFEAFEQTLSAPWALAWYHLAGRWDFCVHIAARDAEDLRDRVMELTASSQVQHLETSLIFGHRGRRALPDFLD